MTTSPTTTDDLVVLLDESGKAIGTAPRATVHTTSTPLHLAFSCHLRDDAGRVLVTRRALGKRTWPGVWTNSFCGHPRPGESFEDAVRRHAQHELGIEVSDIESLLPDFRYHAIDAAGVVENEICPVFSARTASPAPVSNPDEVMEHRWVDVADVLSVVERAPWALSPWLVEQEPALRLLG
ncbi:isopentenyl-diphosphate Delta-isomerase [Nocardioides dongxiaopingii]|uniref:isopentenyl-diphosphate Delta-isomerase n=1 Tax=Nocardioides dongxiaopingii TaxID=2576036 RepID=UPI0010C76C53|nr:isopentenyl-diphosphate Delta-isomerase [Nocardioides dongxiaopingii]